MQNLGKKDNILKIFSNFVSNFQADFGDPCDYYKSAAKILDIFRTPTTFSRVQV